MNTISSIHEGAASLLRELRDRDSETGLLTSGRAYRVLLSEVARTRRYGNPLSCVLVHAPGLGAAGPEIRLQLANRLADSIRNTDYAGIWEDEEFLLILPETDEFGARRFVGKVQSDLSALASYLGAAHGVALTVVTRIATWQGGDDAAALLTRLETRPRV